MKFETKAIHAGQSSDPVTGAVVTPIVTATTFRQKSPGEPLAFEYSRVSTPTRQALEKCFAELEQGSMAFAMASGCAAMHMVTQLLKPGDAVLLEEDLYGGSLRLFEHLKKIQNLRVEILDFSDTSLFQKKIRQVQPQMIWIETPTNPLLKIIDIQKVAQAKEQDCLLVVDNTFATPFFQNPLSLGADIVVHSATKYIGGHSDCLGGLVVSHRPNLKKDFDFINKTIGAVLAPFDSYLLLRSLKTLSLRMQAHSQNAQAIAQFLETHRQVDKVFYPGLKGHPQHDLAQKQMLGFGGMMSFTLKGNPDNTKKFLTRLKLFTLAESLGAVESLIEQPYTMTHNSFGHSKITKNLIRLSVGIEHRDDLLKDLDQAFQSL